jgi:hypothetical protein
LDFVKDAKRPTKHSISVLDENSYIALFNTFTHFGWTTHHPLPLICALITKSVVHIPHLECTTLVMMKLMCLGDKAKMHQLPSIGSKCVYLILTIHSLINRTKVEGCNTHQASHTQPRERNFSKLPPLYSSYLANTQKIERKPKTLTDQNWVITNSDWVEPKIESVCLEVFYLPSKFHINRSRFDYQKVGRSKLPSIWTEILNSNR